MCDTIEWNGTAFWSNRWWRKCYARHTPIHGESHPSWWSFLWCNDHQQSLAGDRRSLCVQVGAEIKTVFNKTNQLLKNISLFFFSILNIHPFWFDHVALLVRIDEMDFIDIITGKCSGLNNILRPNQIKGVLGLHKISEFRKPNALDGNAHDDTLDKSAYEIGFKQIVVHPGYQCRQPDNDIGKDHQRFHFKWLTLTFIFTFGWQTLSFIIWCYGIKTALLELSQPIAFTDAVKPICIANASTKHNHSYAGASAIISGWGYTNENQEIGTFSCHW